MNAWEEIGGDENKKEHNGSRGKDPVQVHARLAFCQLLVAGHV
jgi:hypothetical protein